MTCRCHSDLMYASLVDCPKCGHRSFDPGRTWGGCERRRCGWETTDREVLARLRNEPTTHSAPPVRTGR